MFNSISGARNEAVDPGGPQSWDSAELPGDMTPVPQSFTGRFLCVHQPLAARRVVRFIDRAGVFFSLPSPDAFLPHSNT
jgi:hypothetical protein